MGGRICYGTENGMTRVDVFVDLTLSWLWGAVAQWLERATDNRVVAGSNPAEAVWKHWQFPLGTPLCQCLSEETLKAVGPFYVVSMPGEVKDPTRG